MHEAILSFLNAIFVSGLAVDLALIVLAIEFFYLVLKGRSGTVKSRAFALVLALGPGACLMLALRAALTGASIVWVALFLALSLPLHVGDLVSRKI
jgi:hypothetical protein